MTWIECAVIVLAGTGAGIINTVVGSGTLITFPVLLWAGLPPVAANVANNIGLAPGSVSGAVGYRKELSGSGKRVVRFSAAALVGGACGAVLLTVLPPGVFRVAAPVLIALALVLVLAEPWLGRRLESWREAAPSQGSRSMMVAVFLTSVYGGYFGAGQGVILLAVMAVLMSEPLQQVNALKNVLQGVDNVASALMFVLIAQVDWLVVALLAGGAIVGGQIGAKVGRRLPPGVLRAFIVVVGVAGIFQLLR
ncbi:MAG: sulfite exporter TauE/SafE family protein [Rubrobacteraceae bacterium]|nr:sulfite exporter TauE/SafE family protein [Rubrobacteraceae bacterium]